MYRGNPHLTGVVQSSGLRHFHQVKWEVEGWFAVHLPLVASQDLIYATWLTGMQVEIHAIEKETGTLRWRWKPGQNEFAGQAHLHLEQGMLYYPVRAAQPPPGSDGAFLYAFDVQTGQVLRRISIPLLPNRAMFNQFTMHDGVVYLYGMRGNAPGGDQYFCAAVDLQTEQLLWMTDLGVRLYSPSPVAAHGMVYLQTYDQPAPRYRTPMHLHALNAQTGGLVWEYESQRGPVRDFAVAGTDLFFLSESGLEVIDALGGTRKWNWTSQGLMPNDSPTITDEFVYLSSKGRCSVIKTEPDLVGEEEIWTGEMVVLERATKQQRWRGEANEGQDSTNGAIVAGELLYAVWKQLDTRPAAINATLFVLDLRTGQEYWRFDAAQLSTPLVTDGNVFLVRGQGEGTNTFLCALA